MSDRAIRLFFFSAAILMGLAIIFLCCYIAVLEKDLVEAYSYNSELHQQIAQSAKAYDDAIKQVWQLEAELDYYKTSHKRLEEVYNQLLLNPVKEEVIVYRNIYSRDFASVEEFREWYGAQEFKPLFPSGAYLVDCDDYAIRLQRVALEMGYSVSQALALNGEYYGKKVTDERGGHAGNLILIGNTYYWVEPQPKKFDIIKVADRD